MHTMEYYSAIFLKKSYCYIQMNVTKILMNERHSYCTYCKSEEWLLGWEDAVLTVKGHNRSWNNSIP